ncbi:unnamed protein product [Ceratitis capitata]|uniref:(Mediterranean fruit fly) hypothetical protein n=1 Tax=Ceratitis capitata TaxID=7213 RepID=A0A811UVQ9_CERCA|nr:unnamed protein product [Ceratitis capitata]
MSGNVEHVMFMSGCKKKNATTLELTASFPLSPSPTSPFRRLAAMSSTGIIMTWCNRRADKYPQTHTHTFLYIYVRVEINRCNTVHAGHMQRLSPLAKAFRWNRNTIIKQQKSGSPL